jgi:hypothetical protein
VDLVPLLLDGPLLRHAVLALRAPVPALRLAAGGALLPQRPGPRGQQTYAEWLTMNT